MFIFLADVAKALQQYTFECMNLPKVDPDCGKIYPVPPYNPRQCNIPWDDPYPYYKSLICAKPQDYWDFPEPCAGEFRLCDDMEDCGEFHDGDTVVEIPCLPIEYGKNFNVLQFYLNAIYI